MFIGLMKLLECKAGPSKRPHIVKMSDNPTLCREKKRTRCNETREAGIKIHGSTPSDIAAGHVDFLKRFPEGVAAMQQCKAVKRHFLKGVEEAMVRASESDDWMIDSLASKLRTLTSRVDMRVISTGLTGTKKKRKIVPLERAVDDNTKAGPVVKLPHAPSQTAVDAYLAKLYADKKLGDIVGLEVPCGAKMGCIKAFIRDRIRVILGCEVLSSQLKWFKNKKNLWVIAYMGDGAPQNKSLGMVIHNLQFLNLKKLIHSSETNHTVFATDGKENGANVKENIVWLGKAFDFLEEFGMDFDGEHHSFLFLPCGDQKWQDIVKGSGGCNATYDNMWYGGVSSSKYRFMAKMGKLATYDQWSAATPAARLTLYYRFSYELRVRLYTESMLELKTLVLVRRKKNKIIISVHVDDPAVTFF
jgi:hypothetical protein